METLHHEYLELRKNQMKNKKILLLLMVLVIAVVGVVVFFISRPQHEELLPQTFAELPEKPKLIATFHHGATRNSETVYPENISHVSALQIYSVAFSPVDSSLIASVNGAGTIKLWNINNTKESVKSLGHPGIFPYIGFSPNGKLLASAGWKLILWDVASGKKVSTLETSYDQFAFSPDGQQLATIPNNEVKLWDIRNPKKVTHIATLPFDETHKGKGWACAVGISSDGKWIAVGYSQGTINVWDLKTRQLVKTLETSFYNMDYIKFSPNNKYMVSGGQEEDMYSTANGKGYIMWETPSWQRKGEVLRGHVENLAFSPDGKMCVSANLFYLYGRGVEIWSTTNGAPIASLPTEATDVSFSQDGTLIVTGGNDGFVRVWELTQSQLDIDKIRNDVVRLVYYLPKDKKPSPNITQKIDKTIIEVQKHYADEMERHGFGIKTFTFETDENGKAKIYRIKEIPIEPHNLQLNDLWLVFVDEKNDIPHIDNIVKRLKSTGRSYSRFDNPFTFPTRWKGIDNDKIRMGKIKGIIGDGSFIYAKKNGFDWKLTAYSLKRLFKVLGEQHSLHKYERYEAEWLDKSRFFNPNQPFFDKRPEIEMDVLKADTASPLFQFTIADEDGIHQLQLFVPKDTESSSRFNKIQGCQALNGEKKANVEFEISNPNIKNGEIRMIDMHGNIASREFWIEEKTDEK